MVKQLLLLVSVVGVFGSFAATASADRGRHDARPGIAFGKAKFTVAAGQDERFGFVAKDRGLPLNDRGFVFYRNATAGFAYEADLDCVSVSGRTARFGYVIPSDASVPAAIRGLGVVFQVVDNGKPGAGRDLVGYVSSPTAATGAAFAAACDTTLVPNLTAIREGNIVVRPGKADRHKPKPKHDDTDDSSDDSTDD